MQLNPRYDDQPIICFEALGDPSGALRRQRLRLLAAVRDLSDAQWSAPSRCDKWSVKDVVSHLVSTDAFWALSFAAAVKGEPTRFLATFDPVATPEQIVDGTRALSPQEVLANYEQSVHGLLEVVDGVSDWSAIAEAPPGHVALNVAALHALWDSWVHERDISVPLGLPATADDEEVTLILQYAAALSPAFSLNRDPALHGALTVEASDPAITFTVAVADAVHNAVVVRPGDAGDGPRLSGPAVDLVEGLSYRAALPDTLGDADRWLLAGVAEVFDLA